MGNLFEDVEPSPLTVARTRTQPKVIDPYHGGLVVLERDGRPLGGANGAVYPFSLFELHDRRAGNG
jgi:hypothetical protein